MIGVYFETWACPWTDKVENCALANVDADKVFLAFAYPNCTYKKGSYSWDGTGLQFSFGFDIVRRSISILQSRGTRVYLSVGGGSYSFTIYKTQNVIDLANDLGVDGIDLDFEPQKPMKPVESQDQFIQIIKQTRGLYKKEISLAAFAAGCFDPVKGDDYRGSMLKVIDQTKQDIQFINLMNYDAGSGWDYKAAYLSYKRYYSGPIYYGLEVGPQGWGDAYLTLEDIKKAKEYNTDDYWFVWAYFKSGTPDFQAVKNSLRSKPDTSPPVSDKPLLVLCPNCHQGVIEIRSK